jgi:hypothetical protein
MVKHKTQSTRLTRKLKAIRQEARQRTHQPLALQHRWIASELRGPLRLFRHAAQLAVSHCLPAGCPADLAQVPATAQSEEPPHGLGVVRRVTARSTVPAPAHHSRRDATESLMRLTFGKSRVREAACPDL